MQRGSTIMEPSTAASAPSDSGMLRSTVRLPCAFDFALTEPSTTRVLCLTRLHRSPRFSDEAYAYVLAILPSLKQTGIVPARRGTVKRFAGYKSRAGGIQGMAAPGDGGAACQLAGSLP